MFTARLRLTLPVMRAARLTLGPFVSLAEFIVGEIRAEAGRRRGRFSLTCAVVAVLLLLCNHRTISTDWFPHAMSADDCYQSVDVVDVKSLSLFFLLLLLLLLLRNKNLTLDCSPLLKDGSERKKGKKSIKMNFMSSTLRLLRWLIYSMAEHYRGNFIIQLKRNLKMKIFGDFIRPLELLTLSFFRLDINDLDWNVYVHISLFSDEKDSSVNSHSTGSDRAHRTSKHSKSLKQEPNQSELDIDLGTRSLPSPLNRLSFGGSWFIHYFITLHIFVRFTGA